MKKRTPIVSENFRQGRFSKEIPQAGGAPSPADDSGNPAKQRGSKAALKWTLVPARRHIDKVKGEFWGVYKTNALGVNDNHSWLI